MMTLNGDWFYLPDPEKQYTAATLPVDNWQTMTLPRNWQFGGLDNYSGVVWFRRTFDWNSPLPQYPVVLSFKGVDYFADVWLNGRFLGHHEGYFQPFEFDALSHLKEGVNEVVVKVDAPFEPPGEQGWPHHKRLIKGIFNHHDCRPGGMDAQHGQDMGSGGIWNSVELIPCEAVRLSRLQIAPTLMNEGATVTFTMNIRNYTSETVSLEIELNIQPENFNADDQHFMLRASHRLIPGENQLIVCKTIPNPHLWSTWDYGTPNLYKVEVSTHYDGKTLNLYEDTFGIREIRVTSDWIFTLNKKRVFLRGTNILPTQWLSEYSSEMIERDIQLMRECHINSVRVHAHVQREEFYRACDRTGILVWADFALQWSYDDTDAFKSNAVAQIRHFVRMLYNRPSIGVWCCHNEPTFNLHSLDPLLLQAVQQEDSTRIATAASDHSQHAYPGWYGGTTIDYQAIPSAPLINEYGAQALPNLDILKEMFDEATLFPTKPEHWCKWAYHDFQYDLTFNVANIEMGDSIETFIENSQRYQAELIAYSTEKYRLQKWKSVHSVYQFMFVDAWQSITWSVLDYQRRPKLGYEALKNVFQPVYIAFGQHWSARRKLEVRNAGWGFSSLTDLTIINDFHHPFPNALLELKLTDTLGNSFPVYHLRLDIPADDVMSLSQMPSIAQERERQHQRFSNTLNQLIPGEYRLIAHLCNAEGKAISKNETSLTFVPTAF